MKKPFTLYYGRLKIFTEILTLLICTTSYGNEVEKGTKDWSIVETYTIPGKASGLAWDGTYIYFGIY